MCSTRNRVKLVCSKNLYLVNPWNPREHFTTALSMSVTYVTYGMQHFLTNVTVGYDPLFLKIFQIWNIFLRNVWYIFVGGEIPNYGQYPFECTCSWISCTNIWISRSSMLNPELESFSAQRHLKRFIHVIELTNRISDIWDDQGQLKINQMDWTLPW